MIYDWYNIFNLTEFLAEDLVSKAYEYEFEGADIKTVLVTKGNYTSVLFDDVFLPINLNDRNPFEYEDRAVYLDENQDVWVGILNED